MPWQLVLALIGVAAVAAVLFRFGPDAYHAARSWNAYRKGLGRYQQGDTAGAEALWREAAAISPYSSSARFGLGKLLAERGDVDGAIEQYREALRARPGYVKARMNLANALLASESFDEALEQYELAAAAGLHRAQKMIGMIQQRHRNDRQRALAAYSQYVYHVGRDPEIEAWIRELTGKSG